MKIRIRGNSIRLRLTQTEVSEIAKGKAVKEITPFPTGNDLEYGLHIHDHETTAEFEDGKINILLSSEKASKWANSDEVGVEAFLDTPNAELRVLIEKDFACLTDREYEDESDAFPNPNLSC